MENNLSESSFNKSNIIETSNKQRTIGLLEKLEVIQYLI